MAKQDTSKTKHILDRNITTHNARDIDGYLANQKPDVEFVLPGGVTLHGRDQVRHYTEALWKAFPDGVLTFGNQVLAEDAAATELVFTGTHTGPMMTPNGPIPPTGKRVTTHSVSILRMNEGRPGCLGACVFRSARNANATRLDASRSGPQRPLCLTR